MRYSMYSKLKKTGIKMGPLFLGTQGINGMLAIAPKKNLFLNYILND